MLARICLLAFLVFSLQSLVSAQVHYPNLELEMRNGESFDLDRLRSPEKPLVLVFWVSWCMPCKFYLNDVDAWAKLAAQESDFEVLTVATNVVKGRRLVDNIMEERKWTFPVLIDQNLELKRVLEVSTMPYTMIINTQGEVTFRKMGPVSKEEIDKQLLICSE